MENKRASRYCVVYQCADGREDWYRVSCKTPVQALEHFDKTGIKAAKIKDIFVSWKIGGKLVLFKKLELSKIFHQYEMKLNNK